jgi:hypothetical protein
VAARINLVSLPQFGRAQGCVTRRGQRLGRQSFFDEAVEAVLSRVAARVGQQGIANQLCEPAAQRMILEAARREARKLKGEIERHFILTGRVVLPTTD